MVFEGHLEISEVEGTDFKKWRLMAPLIYVGNKESWTVPAGTTTDFVTIPRLFWSILAPWGRHMKAAVIHDYLYQTGCVTRLDADRLFYRMMRELGVSWWRRKTMYRTVRLFGAKHYQN